MAARYEIDGEALAQSIVSGSAERIGSIEALDYREDLVLEIALAEASSIDRNRISSMRQVSGDGSSSCWHRQRLAWCPDCFRADLEQHSEVYERAAWRLGCWVVCPVHGQPMQCTCPWCEQCDRRSSCCYQPVDGLLRLGCNVCDRLIDDRRGRNWVEDMRGAFGIMQTQSLVALVREFQSDLTKVLEGEHPTQTWGHKRAGQTLLTITTDLTLALVLSTGMRVVTRLDFSKVARREPLATWHEPVTLAPLPPYVAFGLMALTATFLKTLPAREAAPHQWRPFDRITPLDASSILSWVDQSERSWLKAFSAGWDERTRRALCRLIKHAEKSLQTGVRARDVHAQPLI